MSPFSALEWQTSQTMISPMLASTCFSKSRREPWTFRLPWIGFPPNTRGQLQQMGADERAHANYLSTLITAAGQTPRQPCEYKFCRSAFRLTFGITSQNWCMAEPAFTDVKGFMDLVTVVEGVGISAYLGGLAVLGKKKYVAGTGSILVDETMHNTILRSAHCLHI